MAWELREDDHGLRTPSWSELSCDDDPLSSYCLIDQAPGTQPTIAQLPPTNAQLLAMMQQMQLVMEQHEAEVSSLRLSLTHLAQRSSDIHVMLQKVVRGFLGRQRCIGIRKQAAIQSEINMKAVAATAIQSIWRGRQQRLAIGREHAVVDDVV